MIKGILFVFFLLLGSAQAADMYIPEKYSAIRDCRGGVVNEFHQRFQRDINSNKKYKIDGTMYSACTMITMLPAKNICITKNAKLAYHQGRFMQNAKTSDPLWEAFKHSTCQSNGGVCFVSENAGNSGVNYITWPSRLASDEYLHDQPDWVKEITGGHDDLPFYDWKIIDFDELKKHYKVCE